MNQPVETDPVELTILMPCLNEAETLAVCIQKAQGFLARSGVRGEVLISDNGSTDGSQQIAADLGARVSHAPTPRLGLASRHCSHASHSALITGTGTPAPVPAPGRSVARF